MSAASEYNCKRIFTEEFAQLSAVPWESKDMAGRL